MAIRSVVVKVENPATETLDVTGNGSLKWIVVVENKVVAAFANKSNAAFFASEVHWPDRKLREAAD